MSAFTGLTRDTNGPFMCTKPVDQPTCAWAAISSATLCEVPPGKRRSDSINTSTSAMIGQRTGPDRLHEHQRLEQNPGAMWAQ